MFHRLLKPSGSSSFFLFGARGTGKSFFLEHQFAANNPWHIDLLDPQTEHDYSTHPDRLEALLAGTKKRPDWIMLDEIQRVPKLLNTVHRMIEKQKQKFCLTGSSARKLTRGAANLLAGRAFLYHLYPLTSIELEKTFDLQSALMWGSLPKIFEFNAESDKTEYLKSYSLTYIREEIQQEQIVRKLDPFRAFLPIAAQCSGKIINFTRIAQEVGTDTKTVQNYFQILEDTWLGFFLPAYHRSVRKSQRISPKFYLFDLGVKRALDESIGTPISEKTSLFGEFFEHFIVLEIYRLSSYYGLSYQLSFYLTKHGTEVDLILSKSRIQILIEIKSSEKIDETEVSKLARVRGEFGPTSKAYYLSRSKEQMKIQGVQCMHWQDFLNDLKKL